MEARAPHARATGGAPEAFDPQGGVWRWDDAAQWVRTSTNATPPATEGAVTADGAPRELFAYAGRFGSDGVFYTGAVWDDAKWTAR